MTDSKNPIHIPLVAVESVTSDFQAAELGQWYWHQDDEDDERSLMCVMRVGSNFVELHSPHSQEIGYSYVRVHRDNFARELTLAPDAHIYIREKIAAYQGELSENMAQIQNLNERLGISAPIGGKKDDADGKALAVLSGQVDVKVFQNELVLAQKETLPALFEKNKKLMSNLQCWMSAESMPMLAQIGPMKDSINQIGDRLFNIQLYSGMLEQIVTCQDGEPAALDEKLHIMQRRLYMDEECLLSYESGGMEFADIFAFDAWLCKPENLQRIFPFPRCMVAMKVRRKTKARDHFGTILELFVTMKKMEGDSLTFLYVRNGDQVYRVSTDIDFGEMIFPDSSVFDPSEPMMIKRFGNRFDKMIPRREYDFLVVKDREKERKKKQWELENPKDLWDEKAKGESWWSANPYTSHFYNINEKDWSPFDDSSVYYDDALKSIQSEIKEYNRIALVVQGLFDRTSALMPHHPVQMWKPASFSRSVVMVYDASMVLHWGEAPDIHAYIKRCNQSIDENSVFYGQEIAWMAEEARKENERMDRDYRTPNNQKMYREHIRPYGDPGPGRLAIAKSIKRGNRAEFTWFRERRNARSLSDPIPAKISVPFKDLFNVSAYKKGDFKQFFNDPRTRAQYLEWAPLLLAAEDYCNGKLMAQKPDYVEERGW